MNESSFLKASNIEKINKELTDLKSRKVLTDMLNKQIDANEQLTTENTTLIANQRKLLALLEAKDHTIQEMKTNTSMNSFCQDGVGGIESGFVSNQHQFGNSGMDQQLIEEYEWQMILHRISRGAQIVSSVLGKREMTSKQSVLSVLKSNVSESDRLGLCEVVKNSRVSQGFHIVASLVAAKSRMHAIEFYSSLQRNWIESLQFDVNSIHETSIRQQQQLQAMPSPPIQFHAKFYEKLAANPGKRKIKPVLSAADKEMLEFRRELKSQFSSELDSLYSESSRPIMKRIAKVQVEIQQSSLAQKYKNVVEQYNKLVHETKNLMSQEQVNEFIMKTQNLVKNIQTNYTAKCTEFDELQALHARVNQQVEALKVQLERQEDGIRDAVEQEKQELVKQIGELHAKLKRALDEKESSKREIEAIKSQEIEDVRNDERRAFKESMERMMRQVTRKDEESRAVIETHEKQFEQMKREFLKCQESLKASEFAKEESAMMADQLTRKVQALAQEKVGLLANMEVCVSSLRELKVASDAAHANLSKLKEEKQMFLGELEGKDQMVATLNAKVAELTRKIQASPNRNIKEEAAKLARITQENEQLNETLDELTKTLAKVKKDNQDLTKEAIAIHQEKLTIDEELKASKEEILELEQFRQRLEQRIEEIGTRLSEKEAILAKYIGKPTAMQKLSLEKAEIEEENERLKQEFMELHTSKVRLEEEFKIVSVREASAAEELRENNSNMAALTREKLGFFKELSKLQDKMQKKKKKIALLKDSQAMYQQQIQDYDAQLQMYSKVLKQMDMKSKAAKNTSKNALLNSSNHNNSNQLNLSASMNLNNNNNSMMINQNNNNNNNTSAMMGSQYLQQSQQIPRQQRQKSVYDSNDNPVDSQLINRIEALQTNFYQ